MRVFIDACVDPRVRELLPGHETKTAFDMAWHRLKDHVLLSEIQDRFDVFVTADQGFEHEHNLGRLRFGLIIIHVKKNQIEFYRPLAAQLRKAIEQVRPGEVVHVPPQARAEEAPR